MPSNRYSTSKSILGDAFPKSGVLLTLPLSRQAIADTFSIQKYSLQRCLSELKADGVINFEGRAVHILKPQELEV